MASLLALTGCQKEELVNDNNTPGSGDKVILTANIQGAAQTRVTLTPVTENGTTIVKVAWNESGETFEVYGSSVTPSTFTQIPGTNQFEGTLPESATGEYEVYYGDITSLDEQDGKLGQSTANNSPVLMYAMFDNSSPSITFEHNTAILKPTFKVGNADIDKTITKIVIDNVAKPNPSGGANGMTDGKITIAPTSPATVLDNDIYIHLIAMPQIYKADYEFTFTVTAGGKDYTGSLTIPTGMSIEEGKFYTATIALEEIPYLTFTVGGEQQSLVLNVMGEMDQSIEYSADGRDWKKFVMEGSNATTPVPFENNLCMRGKSASGTVDFESSKGFMISFTENTPVTCSGDIRTLVDYTNYETTSTANACFSSLFMNCSALADASKLELISNNNKMAASCYTYMFAGCESLTSAPALPVTTLAESCYEYMFAWCSTLISAPALPATTLAESCYYRMFAGCTSLISAPALPATTLAQYCYLEMFDDCTSLKSAPALSATTLAKSCYNGMFQGCTSLTTAPELPATTLAQYCYYDMFYYCTSLTTAPALPATTLAESCYGNMYKDCTSLESAPALSATTLAKSCYNGMFQGCTSLTTAPELPAETLVTGCYWKMFKDCTSLNSVTMLATDIAATDCLTDWMSNVAATGTFIKAASMTSLPTGVNGIPSGWTVTDYGQSEY